MTQGGDRKNSGFTIVETLIVLAVTGFLFLSAVILISGRTAKTQFTTATNNLKDSIQQVINETASGYFPNSNNFSCTYLGATSPKLQNAVQAQGTNGDCVFLGKAVQFGATDHPDNFLAYAITGNRLQAASSQEVTTLAQAFPEAIAPGIGHNPGLQGVTTLRPIENGLTVSTMRYNGATDTSGFAFLSTLATYTAGGSTCSGVCSGARGLALYAIQGTKVNTQDSKSFVDVLDSGSVKYIATPSVTICLDSGTTNQSAVYTIGGNAAHASVDMRVQAGACP